MQYVAQREASRLSQEDFTPLCDPRFVIPHLARLDLMPSAVWGDDRLYLKLPEFVCYVARPPDVAIAFVLADDGDVLGIEQVIEFGILGLSRIGENEG